MNVIDFPGAFPEQLCRQGHETLTDPDERWALAKLLRHHRATVSIEIRATRQRLERLHQILAECDGLIQPLEGDPETEA